MTENTVEMDLPHDRIDVLKLRKLYEELRVVIAKNPIGPEELALVVSGIIGSSVLLATEKNYNNGKELFYIYKRYINKTFKHVNEFE